MGRRYAFELFYPVERVADAVTALDPYRPSRYRKRRGELVRVERYVSRDLSGLSPETPLFGDLTLLFPADDVVRQFVGPEPYDHKMEWDDEGNEYLPVGNIKTATRIGTTYAAFTYQACSRSISDVFERSRPIWHQFHHILQSAGGLIALFDKRTEIGKQKYPVLPDGSILTEFDYREFILEERDHYWHLDVDRYASAVLRAAGRTN